MGKKKFTRIICLAMALLLLVSGVAVAVSADTVNSVTDKSIEDYIDALGTLSYEEYMAKYAGKVAASEQTLAFDATKNWVFKSTAGEIVEIKDGNWTLTVKNGETEKTYTLDEVKAADSGLDIYDYVHPTTQDGIAGLYIPSLGTVKWTLDLKSLGVTDAAFYNLSLDYYPVKGKTGSIEREFYINGEVPFKEARSLTLQKRWSSYASETDEGGTLLVASYTPTKKQVKAAGGLVPALNALCDEAKAAGLVAYLSQDSTTLLVEQPKVSTPKNSAFLDKYTIRFFVTDLLNNELRPTMLQDPTWMHFTVQDSSGYYTIPLSFMIAPEEETGCATLEFRGVNEAVVISNIILEKPASAYQTYAQYLESLKGKLGTTDLPEGTSEVKIEGEHTIYTSTNVVYPVEDRSDALTSPVDTGRTMLNTIGTEKWQTAGQWVEYQFSVDAAGMYELFARFKQSYLDGMYVCRMLKIYTSDANGNRYETEADYVAAKGNSAGYYNGVPFDEASRWRFDYNAGWQVKGLTDGSIDADSCKLYFDTGVVYTLHLEVTLGSMSTLVRQIEEILNGLNNDYLSIIKLTGTTPDDYRDYNFYRLLPDTMIDMIIQSEALAIVSETLKNDAAGVASSYTGVCDQLSTLLEKMGRKEDEIAKNLDNFKSYIGSLGTFLSDAKTQPLQIDYLQIQGASKEAPKAKAGFFKALGHEIANFWMSFFRDYNSMGAMAESGEGTDGQSVNVWLAYGRDQSQVIRNLCTNDFTPDSKISVDLKLISGGTLLPSILAGVGPDAYLGLGQTEVINYAIRGALMNVENMDGFDTITQNFNEAAMMVLGTVDADGDMHYYGLPENQGFAMMFIRTDILAELNIEIPKTWEDIYVAQSKLESNNMEIGLAVDYNMYLYQMGGELFADDGMRINLESELGLKAFETMCNMFTQYSFPYKYDAANRFRTGEMPIIIAGYTGLYNHLKVFATELDGSWIFVPLPGYEYEKEDGTLGINNCAVSSVTAVVLIKKENNNYKNAWEFTKWYTDAPCQADYANEMVAILGESAKHSTANREALESMPWTPDEYAEVSKQFENLASIPNYPGYYILGRYTEFAFLSAYNDDADPKTELLSYINIINKEITRKREEFKLETLEIGQTLLDKRIDQTLIAMDSLQKINAEYNTLIYTAKQAIANDQYTQIEELSVLFAEKLAAKWDQSTMTIVKASGEEVTVPTYYKNVGKQTSESKFGGYSIQSLNELQLLYFISECMMDIVEAV